MRYLRDHLDGIKELIAARGIALFLDYDGTLTPIVDSPEKARLPERTRALLEKLNKCPGVSVALISGRSLADLRRMADIRGIVYAGSHGLELDGPKIRFSKVTSAKYKKLIARIKAELRAELKAYKGAFLEDKGLVLTVHYRLLAQKKVNALKTLFHETVSPHIAKGELRVKEGKKVLEIKPDLEWDKGKAVLWLLARQTFARSRKLLPIYIGDDITDEDVFAALKGRGLTVYCGSPGQKSRAEYYLKSPAEVRDFLEAVLNIKCPTNKKT